MECTIVFVVGIWSKCDTPINFLWKFSNINFFDIIFQEFLFKFSNHTSIQFNEIKFLGT